MLFYRSCWQSIWTPTFTTCPCYLDWRRPSTSFASSSRGFFTCWSTCVGPRIPWEKGNPLPGTYFSLVGQPASAHGFPRKKVKFSFTWNVLFTCQPSLERTFNAGQPASAHRFPGKKVKISFTWNVFFTCWSTCVGPQIPWEKGKISFAWNVFFTCWSTCVDAQIPWGTCKISFRIVFFACWSTCFGPGISLGKR